MIFPVQPDQMTELWLTDTLRAAKVLGTACVVSIEVRKMAPDKGMTGVLARLVLDYDQVEAEAPSSLVAKFSSPHPDARAVVTSMGFHEKEVRFYQEFAGATPVRTPTCYFAAVDLDKGHSLILLEDLSTAREVSWGTGGTLAETQVAVEAIAAVHAAWWESPRLQESTWLSLRGFVSIDQFPGVVDQSWQSFLGKFSVTVTDQFLRIGELLRQRLPEVMDHLFGSRPQTLLHGDFHAENVLFAIRDDQLTVAVLDWQLVTAGSGAVDVAWFVAGQLDTGTRRANEHQLVRLYHSTLVRHGVTEYTFEQCWDAYRVALLLPAARISSSVGVNPLLQAAHGGFWDVVFPRYCQAIDDLGVAQLLAAGNVSSAGVPREVYRGITLVTLVRAG